MNVSLPGDMVEFVEHEVSQGGYGSSSEVIREVLRLLRREKAQQAEKLAILRREISIGVEAADAGRGGQRLMPISYAAVPGRAQIRRSSLDHQYWERATDQRMPL
ncbi:type II toxin-antitoxin system ParD family antitoxin [Mesorhizobium sp.]|uniref:type II toxin-antitoxin system ParD family antitoxin n=1 Tax=Mesorhizobium sp. TaxID=1871066 RepID=UPI00338F751F